PGIAGESTLEVLAGQERRSFSFRSRQCRQENCIGGEAPRPSPCRRHSVIWRTAMTRLLSFNPEPFEAESEMNGALRMQWLTRGTAGQRRRPTRPALPPLPGPAAFDAEALRKKAVEIAKQELARWGNGKIKETDPRLRQTLQDYWKTGTGASFSQDQLGNPAFQKANP